MKVDTGLRPAFRTVQNCSASPSPIGEVFRDSGAGNRRLLDVIIPSVAYPKGSVLFLEGQPARGVFALCSGEVKLSTSSLDGRAITLKIAEAGELLGLPATLSGRPYEATAIVAGPARANFIPRDWFLRYLRLNPEAVFEVAQMLTESHFARHALIQSLGLSHSASQKLARFFLAWSANHSGGQDHLRIPFTHQEIGEMIGVSRETVTRLLTSLRERNLLSVKDGTVQICDRAGLQSLAGA